MRLFVVKASKEGVLHGALAHGLQVGILPQGNLIPLEGLDGGEDDGGWHHLFPDVSDGDQVGLHVLGLG